jgi:hypothetical protein
MEVIFVSISSLQNDYGKFQNILNEGLWSEHLAYGLFSALEGQSL